MPALLRLAFGLRFGVLQQVLEVFGFPDSRWKRAVMLGGQSGGRSMAVASGGVVVYKRQPNVGRIEGGEVARGNASRASRH